MPQCSACKAAILWAVTETGAAQPLDVVPVVGGNIRLRTDLPKRTSRKGGWGYLAEVVTTTRATLLDQREPEPLHMPHHATCVYAERFRKRKR